MSIASLSHREGLFWQSKTVCNHAKTVVSIQAVSLLLESLYLSQGDSSTGKRRDGIADAMWNYFESSGVGMLDLIIPQAHLARTYVV